MDAEAMPTLHRSAGSIGTGALAIIGCAVGVAIGAIAFPARSHQIPADQFERATTIPRMSTEATSPAGPQAKSPLTLDDAVSVILGVNRDQANWEEVRSAWAVLADRSIAHALRRDSLRRLAEAATTDDDERSRTILLAYRSLRDIATGEEGLAYAALLARRIAMMRSDEAFALALWMLWEPGIEVSRSDDLAPVRERAMRVASVGAGSSRIYSLQFMARQRGESHTAAHVAELALRAYREVGVGLQGDVADILALIVHGECDAGTLRCTSAGQLVADAMDEPRYLPFRTRPLRNWPAQARAVARSIGLDLAESEAAAVSLHHVIARGRANLPAAKVTGYFVPLPDGRLREVDCGGTQERDGFQDVIFLGRSKAQGYLLFLCTKRRVHSELWYPERIAAVDDGTGRNYVVDLETKVEDLEKKIHPDIGFAIKFPNYIRRKKGILDLVAENGTILTVRDSVYHKEENPDCVVVSESLEKFKNFELDCVARTDGAVSPDAYSKIYAHAYRAIFDVSGGSAYVRRGRIQDYMRFVHMENAIYAVELYVATSALGTIIVQENGYMLVIKKWDGLTEFKTGKFHEARIKEDTLVPVRTLSDFFLQGVATFVVIVSGAGGVESRKCYTFNVKLTAVDEARCERPQK
ncbi:MAG: hypothetical protein JNK11_10580 [Alphaproteobacteria bacterium]|nr:hypothetical protein [Alphaproteobacteria bacterium]